MSRGASLLSRIRRPELAVARRRVSERELRDDILEHLRGICSTRLGAALACPEYGIPDMSEMFVSFPDAIRKIGTALRFCIETYEPRLAEVRVTHVPDAADLLLRFEILARLVTEEGTKLKFETRVDMSRKITIT